MLQKLSSLAIAFLLLLLPSRLFAGGPPWLCLPIDGVTVASAKECAGLLNSKLKDKFSGDVEERQIKVLQHADQWYLTFYMGEDVALGDVDAALQGSKFSVPRDRLRLFGHSVLEIDTRAASAKDLLADLEAASYVSVAESERRKDRFLVTLDIPYPVETDRERGVVGWEKFRRNDLSSDQAARGSESPATPQTLPAYAALRDVVAKHKASLKDVRWDMNYACRPLGGVAVPDSKGTVSAQSTAR